MGTSLTVSVFKNGRRPLPVVGLLVGISPVGENFDVLCRFVVEG